MTLRPWLKLAGLIALTTVGIGCGAGGADVGGKQQDGGTGSGVDAGGTNNACTPAVEVCDGIDNDCDNDVDEGFDADGDTYSGCTYAAAADCNDANKDIHPGALELANDLDDNCDGKIDLGVAGVDYDKDGTPYPQDCNDDQPLVGPNAIEVGGDGTDNDCNGKVDDLINCEGEITGATGSDFAKALGLCGSYVTSATFTKGNSGARAIRAKFGDNWAPKEGTKMVQLSSGRAVDNLDDSGYRPQSGTIYGSADTHPLWAPPKCANGGSAPAAEDLTVFRLVMTVPQNAKSFSYQLNFFSAEYPEWVCTQYNDRFIAILKSTALDPTKLPGGKTPNCTSSTTPECNISFDSNGQPLTINNGFFSVCQSFSGTGSEGQQVNNTCTPDTVPLLAKTGYDNLDGAGRPLGGGTGWLTTKAPVKPGETIELRFVILDEGDAQYDSTILLDNFKWEAQEVTAPTTDPIG